MVHLAPACNLTCGVVHPDAMPPRPPCVTKDQLHCWVLHDDACRRSADVGGESADAELWCSAVLRPNYRPSASAALVRCVGAPSAAGCTTPRVHRRHRRLRAPPPPQRDATARHRRPKPPLWAFALLFVIAALAMAGGVGGGGLFVPLLSLGLGCTPHEATALSQALICGASFGALASNARARHPTADRPLIDLRVVAFLGPAEMAGALVGVLLNKTLPSLVILMAMALVLSATAVQTCRKGAAQLAADSRRLER